MYCDRSLPPVRNAEHGYQAGVVAWLRSVSHLRRTNTSHSGFGCQPLYSGLVAAAVAGGRRIFRQRRHHGKSRLQMFSTILEAPHQRTATEVFVDFDTLVRWLVDMERRRGKDVPRTYRSLDRRVKSLMRRLRARGVELCFIVANEAAPCCSEPEDAHLWLAEEQIKASLERAGCCWKRCGDGSSPSDVLSRLVQNDPDIAAVFGVDTAQLSPAAAEWVVRQGTADVQNEEALQRLAILVDETPQRGQFPIRSGECKAATLEDGCFVDAGLAFHWRQAQGSSGSETMEGGLLELALFLRQQPLQDQMCRLPMQARAWLLERALRTAGLSDNWLEEWAELTEKLVMRFDAGTDCDKFQIQEYGLAAAATFLLACSAPLMEEELEALAWTLELMRPRRQPTAFNNSMMASLDKILAEFDEPELDDRAAAVAIAFQDILRGFLYLGHTMALQEPWLMEPRECFDNVLFRKLLLALQSGADLRQRLGGRGLRRPGRGGGLSGAEGGPGNSGLAATRGARLARLLTTALPLASDDEQEKQDKLADLIQREQEIKDDCFNDEVEEPKFSASAWREGFGSRGVTASMPPANEKLNQLKPDQEAMATDAEEKTQKTHRPNAETASLAQRTQKQKKKPPRGAMWFVPGETETASKAKSKVMQKETQETVETIHEEPKDTDQELTGVSADDPWQTLEDNRQLAWAFAQESESEPVDVWDQAPDANLKAMAWEELEKAEIELSKLKEEGLGLHQEEEPLEPLTTEPPQELPIEALRTDILERVRQHRATILVGATGCGKSTRLPQYIMEEPGSKVLVTQPRRVAAVEIAKRVAAERGERVGKNVGYRISGETVAGNGKLQFATIGYVLTWFLAKPEQFESFSHIIIDEVHERGADMELFLLLTKLLMYFFPRTKVILMSATMQPEEFSSYFSDFEVGDPLTVPGRTFPVQEVFLDDLLTDYRHILPTSVLSMAEEAVEEFDQLSKSQAEILQGLPELAVELVPYFAKKNTTLLIFLPGLVELNKLSDLFSSSEEALSALPTSNREAPTNYKVFVLHSMVPRAEQEEVFKQPTGGCCHIVLASNIAESSLTLPQVAAVIDFGLHREPVFDPKQGLNCLSTTWCSHASVRQRGGRAGRTQPGIAIRLFTRHIYEEVMAEFDTPEILRTSFSRLFLRAKKLSEVLQKTAARFSAQCPLDLSSARSLLGSLPQPPNTALVKSAVAELANSGALTAPDEAAEITSLGIFMDGLPLDVSLCRLVWFGTLWGCTIEAVVMAAACSSKDPFNSPSRIFAESDEAYLAGLRLSWMARRRFDGGHFSEPIMMLRLFAYWAMHFGKLAQLKGKARFDTALGIVSKNANIHPGRFQSFLANIMDLAERARFLPLPGSPETVAKTMQDLGRLMSFFRCENIGPSLLRTKSEMKLRALLAAAFSEQLLVGRRFIDQLRGPPKRPRGAGAMASVLAGPRKAEEDEEEAQSYDHPTDETEPDDIFDLNAELATIEEDEDDLNDDDDEESQDLEDDDDVATGDDVQTRLPWKKARDEMIWAVNSLPEKGRKVHQRTVVAKLQTSPQDTAGTVTLDRLPDVMAKLAGRAPQHVARKGKESEFAAVCFPRETVKELDLPSGPSFLTPPTLEGATPSASISHSFSMGSFFVDFDGDLVARPSSPYQLSFFLPERNTSSEEDKQQQIRGVLEARNPVGFPCHVNAGDDFFCTAASMQLLGSRTSVRVNGVTIFRAAEILFALATLCPERSFMSVRLGHGPAGGSRPSSPEHLLAVKILGWEISLLGDERGEGGAVVAEEALEAIQEVRASIKAAMARSDEDDTIEEDNEPKKRKLRPSRYEDTPEKVLDKLLAVVQEAAERLSFSIDHQMRLHEAAERGRKRREKLKATKEAEVLLAGEESGFVDFLRPLEFCKDPAVAAARSLKRWAKKAPAAKFRCPVCEEVFVRARACRKHLKTTGHLCREAGQSWKSLVEERCLLEPAQLKQT